MNIRAIALALTAALWVSSANAQSFNNSGNATVSVSSSSSSQQLPNGDNILLLTNNGTVDLWVRLGGAGVIATQNDLWIGAGRAITVATFGSTWIAAVTALSPSTLQIAQGVGTPQISGGGGSSGGSGSNASVGTIGSAAPGSATLGGLIDGSGNLQGNSLTNPYFFTWSFNGQLVDPSVPVPIIGPTVVTTDDSGSISSGGVAQTAIALNTNRKGWCVSNPSSATYQGIGTAESLFVRVNGTASTTTGTEIQPGQTVCNIPYTVDHAAVSVFGATTSHKYLASEVQ